MSDAAPFPDNAWLTYREATQRWGLQMRKDQTEYIRKDASDAAIAAARAEGVREGMLKAAEIADAHEKRWNDTAYDRRQNGRDDNFACACASASTHIGIEIRAAAESQP